MKYNLINQDAFEAMTGMPDASFDACLCDPPYGIGFMGKGWDHGIPSEVVWAELLRVLKPGAFLIAFGGTRTYHRLTCAVEDAGFEIRDCLMWVYGTGFPKSHNISKALDKAAGVESKKTGPVVYGDGHVQNHGGGKQGYHDWAAKGVHCGTTPTSSFAKQFDGYGTALKPAWEPCILAMKPLDGTFANNAATHGVAGLNIDNCRVPTEETITNHARSADAAISKGAYGDSKAQSTHQSPGQALGRWPANLIHDGSDEVLEGFPVTGATRASQRGPGKGASDTYGVYGGGSTVRGHNDSGGTTARFFYCAKASKAEKNAGCASLPTGQAKGGGGTSDASDFVCGAYGSVKAVSRNSHPTVKPLALCKYLATLILPPGARARKIIIPFSGSGSEMLGAAEAGWEDITGIESDTESGYIAVAEARLKHYQESLNDESTT